MQLNIKFNLVFLWKEMRFYTVSVSALLTRGPHGLSVVRGCHLHCGVLGSILGSHDMPSLKLWQQKMSPDFAKCLLQREGEGEIALIGETLP